jgi:hypothetical protein
MDNFFVILKKESFIKKFFFEKIGQILFKI